MVCNGEGSGIVVLEEMENAKKGELIYTLN